MKRVRVSFACRILGVVLIAALYAAPAAAGEGDDLLLVAAPESSSETTELTRLVFDQVLTGVQSAIGQKHEGKYGAYLAEGQVTGEQKHVFEILRDYAKYSNKRPEAEARNIQNRFKNRKPAGFLLVRVSRADGKTLVTLSHHRIQDEFPLVSLKSIEGAESDARFLDRLREAARSSVGPDGASAPVPTVNASPWLDVDLGQSVVLDASASEDPDFDAIRWEWLDPQGKIVGRTRSIRVTPSEPGEHVYRVRVTEIVGGLSGEKAATVHVRELIASAGQSRMVPFNPPQRLELRACDSRAPPGASYEWQQTAGPMVEAPRRAPELGCGEKVWTVVPREPGLYTFELTVRHGSRVAKSKVSYLVVTPPRVIAGPRTIYAKPNVRMVLDRSSIQDPLDPNPEIYWELLEEDTSNAVLSDPRERAPTFTAFRSGEYKLRLSVRAKRSFNGLDLVDVADDEITIQAQRPAWTLFLISDTAVLLNGEDYYELTSAGLNLIFLRDVLGMDLGLRWAQALARTTLRGEMDLSDRVAAGGGLSIGPSVTVPIRLPFAETDFTAFAGYRYRFDEKGFDLGVQALVHLFDHVAFLPTAGYEQLWPDEGGESRRYVKLGAGLGYQP